MVASESPPIQTWNASEDEPRAKRGIPAWIWLLASCAGVLVVLALGAGFFAYRFARHALDQTKQWEELGKALPLRGEPPPIFIIGLPSIQGRQVWSMVDTSGLHPAVLMHLNGEKAAKERGSIQDPGSSSLLVNSKPDPDAPMLESTVLVQGRSLPCVRFRATPAEEKNEVSISKKERRIDVRFHLGEMPKNSAFSGPVILVDLTPEGSADALLFAFGSPTEDQVSDEEVSDFLAPFRVGSGQ
jgi:hypothetical protein